MRKIQLLTTLSLVTAIPAAAGFGSVVSSFPIPSQIPWCDGLAYDGNYLWMCHVRGNHFFRVSTMGSLVSSFRLTTAPYHDYEGATFDGTYLWCSEYYSSPPPGMVFYNCFTTAGSFVRSFTHPPYPLYYAGMTYQPGYLWGERFKYNMAGSLVGSFPAPFSLVDLAWDGHYLWSYNKQLTTTGSFIASFAVPTEGMDVPQLRGGTTFDGEYIWLTVGTWAYQFDIGVTGANPGSLGKIKALYR